MKIINIIEVFRELNGDSTKKKQILKKQKKKHKKAGVFDNIKQNSGLELEDTIQSPAKV